MTSSEQLIFVQHQIRDLLENQSSTELGDKAIWSLSSSKNGFGVEQIRDNNVNTYWQSSGPQPHLINIQFQKKVSIQKILLYSNYKLDESYTPAKILVRSGTNFHDLQDIKVIDLDEPQGWELIDLTDLSKERSQKTKNEKQQKPEDQEDTEEGEIDLRPDQLYYLRNQRKKERERGIRTLFIQLAILANHQSGRDTHVRQIKIFGNRNQITQDFGIPEFQSQEFYSYSSLR